MKEELKLFYFSSNYPMDFFVCCGDIKYIQY